MRSLLRSVADALRVDEPGDNRRVGFCHNGQMGMCEPCPCHYDKGSCPLSEDEHLAAWISWQVRDIVDDPAKWASDAYMQAYTWHNPAMLMLFKMLLETARETEHPVLSAPLPHFEIVLVTLGDLRQFAEDARQWAAKNPAYQDVAEIAGELVGLARDGPAATTPELEMVDGICMNPTSGRPTSEWPRPLGRHVNVAQGKGIVKT